MIYTAGPDLTGNEEKYLIEAIKQWKNGDHNGYIEQLEAALQVYLGTRSRIIDRCQEIENPYVKLTNSGTGALHLACLACGLGPGDEVITGDISYIASANAIEYTGAKPVFCDVDGPSLCIDAEKIESLITPRTKAIMPIYMYGHMPNMDRIMSIANDYGLYVIADACPSIGASQKYNEKQHKAGSIADISCFSFQGAKTVTTGEGGALVTYDSKLFDRVLFYNNNCEVPGKKFYHIGVGHCYDISNILAAFGLAQLERVDDFVSRKRRIYETYKDKLAKPLGLQMQESDSKTFPSYWMSTMFLPTVDDVVLSVEKRVEYRLQIMMNMKANGVDVRPVFYPISSFKHYHNTDWMNTSPELLRRTDRLSLAGINLPSGVMLSKKDLNCVCEVTQDVIQKFCA